MTDFIAELRDAKVPCLWRERMAADALKAKNERIALYEKQMGEFAKRSEDDKTVLRARIAELEAALKPFADVYVGDHAPDIAKIYDYLTIGHIRAARAALEKKG